MRLCALYLHNFRIYEEAVYEFGPKVNVISGPNAKGKTSILEAIYFLMTGRSFRTSQVSDLIRHGAPYFYIEASFIKHDIKQRLSISCNGKERKIIYNATPCTSSSDLLGLMQGTIIHPDDVAVIKGAPEIRRRFLDLTIAQANPLYVHHMARYTKAMRQRNHLLKAKTTKTIESWEHEMAHSASYIAHQRIQTTLDIEEKAQELHGHICKSSDHLKLNYKSAQKEALASISDLSVLRDHYLGQFQKLRKREMELGQTLAGPHKDDLFVGLNNQEARFFASEGQQRSCVISLRLAEWQRLKAVSYELPLMLIDDVGISLDLSRRAQLFDYIACLDQVFLTTTDALPFDPADATHITL